MREDRPAAVPVSFFRPRRKGPECVVEDQVIESLPALFGSAHPAWMAGSLPLGAGIPDLIVARYRPLALGLAGSGVTETSILAYLRVIGRARRDTIAARLRLSPQVTELGVKTLLRAQALVDSDGTMSLAPICRDILPDVTAIEVKVGDWRRALGQAMRNRVFAHRSFIALPDATAERAIGASLLLKSGVGVISIATNGAATIARDAVKGQPRVWAYYYRLATLIGQRFVEAA